MSEADASKAKEISKSGNFGSVIAVLKDSFVVLTGDDYLQIREVQLEGKKRMDVKAFLLGYKVSAGDKLG